MLQKADQEDLDRVVNQAVNIQDLNLEVEILNLNVLQLHSQMAK